MNLYLIRHGKIIRNGTNDDYFYRLSNDGNNDALTAALFIKDNYFDNKESNVLLTSNTIRTIETSLYLSDILKLKVNIIDNCEEINMGYNECKDKKNWLYVDCNNQFTDRIGMNDNERFFIKHYLGESPYDVYKRLEQLEKIIRKFDFDNYYIVGHGTSLRLLTMRLLNESAEWFYKEEVPGNCSIRKLELSKNKVINNYYIRK